MRPDRDEYFLRMAELVATRSTCLRRHVGCVLVNARGHVLATGYNGVAAGLPHCNQETKTFQLGQVIECNEPGGISRVVYPSFEYEHMCPGANSPSGTNLDGCEAIHGEENALLQCRDVWEIETCYCTTAPCFSCLKKLMNTSCSRIVFLDDYPQSIKSKDLWLRSPNERKWMHYPKSW
jgi:dCMP deaminase